MIVVNLKGGLGNQLFQYAAGFSLAVRHTTNLLLDTIQLDASTASENYTKRHFELDIFSFEPEFASPEMLLHFQKKETTTWQRIGRRLFPNALKWRTYRLEDLRYDKEFERFRDYIYLNGYFQSERYFAPVADQLRKHLQFRKAPSPENAKLLHQINSCMAVSLHVRRGDYLTPLNQKIFGNICTPDYYQKAISMIIKDVEQPSFFVFSDDIEWAKANIYISDFPVHYVNINTGHTPYEDLRLMSNCRHHIIANSSFSWWGAWLNPRADKIVLAPPAWIHDPGCVLNDVIPNSWTIVK